MSLDNKNCMCGHRRHMHDRRGCTVWRCDCVCFVEANKATATDEIGAAKPQVKPQGKGAEIAELVKADIEARAQMGETKYGERLRANNGRNALMDLYQEILDAAMYIRQRLEEEKAG